MSVYDCTNSQVGTSSETEFYFVRAIGPVLGRLTLRNLRNFWQQSALFLPSVVLITFKGFELKAMTYRQYEALRYRASYAVYLAYRLNKYECWTLFQLSGYLQSVGREIVSRALFLDSLSGNKRMKSKILGYYYGLLAKGMLGTFEYIGRPGSLCIGITDLGLQAIKLYELELTRLDAKRARVNKYTHTKKNYRPIVTEQRRTTNNFVETSNKPYIG